MLDTKKLEYYLRLQAHYGNSDLFPKGANDIRVFQTKKLSGGVNNKVYSFLLRFNVGASEKHLNLILKGYSGELGLWFGVSRPDEELRKYVREFETLKSLQGVGFPVSKAYLCEQDSFFLGYPFLIMQEETSVQEFISNFDCFANTLASLHNLEANKLGIRSLRPPENDSEFANDRVSCLKKYVNEYRHYGFLKKRFDYALRWLESNVSENNCPTYSLIHGEYHPGHTLLSNDNILAVIDWESVTIGDPAFDVGYAYHMVKMMSNQKVPNSGEMAADQFVSEYIRNFGGDVSRRLEFYKVIGILGVAVVVSSWVSNPLRAYRLFGRTSLGRVIAFPFLRSSFLGKRWLDEDFLISCLNYCQDFIQTTLKK